ncbi:MAG: tyrosine-type recombinase/integrase [Candidatus Acidiferrales bacterium]
MIKSFTSGPQRFADIGRGWLDSLPTTIRRNGKPLADNTQRLYRASFERIVMKLGGDVLPITNKTLKAYVAELRLEGYSGSSIVADLTVCKLIQESLTSDDGDPVYPMRIRHDFVLTPSVVAENTPCATAADVERAFSLSGLIPGAIAIASGSGLRISEILALQLDEVNGTEDCYDASNSIIHIRRTLKTPSASRSIPLPADLNDFLVHFVAENNCIAGQRIFGRLSRSEIYRELEKADLPAPHSYRRFFTTHRRKAGMNEEILKRLLGHSRGGDITSRYSRASDDLNFIRQEVERVGLGFQFPKAVATSSEELVAV